MNLLLPPANEVCEGYVFTGVCLSAGGVSAPLHAGIHSPPGAGHTPLVGTPLGRYTPQQIHAPAGSPLAGTPPGRYTPQGRYTPLAGTPSLGRYTPWQVHPPPGRYTHTHPLCSAYWDAANKRAVRILLECNLVFNLYLNILPSFSWDIPEMLFRKRTGRKVSFIRKDFLRRYLHIQSIHIGRVQHRADTDSMHFHGQFRNQSA